MFELTGSQDGIRFKSQYRASNEKEAKFIVASYLMSVRELYYTADFYEKGCIVVLDTPSEKATIELTKKLNEKLFNK